MIRTFCDRSLLMLALLVLIVGCQAAKDEPVAENKASVNSADAVTGKDAKTDSNALPEAEVTAEQLLAARLPEPEVSEGWIRLFDGHTLFGWQIAGDANWRVEDGSIVVDDGDACLLCTSVPWQNFELVVEYKAGSDTNSGVFLRTPLNPENPAEIYHSIKKLIDDNKVNSKNES